MIMIGFATEQNTTNLIPAVHFKDDDNNVFICLKTDKTRAGKTLDAGFKEILEAPPFGFRVITEDIKSNNLGCLRNDILDFIERKYDDNDIIWNLGGGQKIHSLALWEAFRKRNNKGDYACYIDADKHEIGTYINKDLDFDQGVHEKGGKIDITDSGLKAEHLLQLHYAAEPNALTFYKKAFNCQTELTAFDDKYDEPAFRAYTYALAKTNPLEEDEPFTLKYLKGKFAEDGFVNSFKTALPKFLVEANQKAEDQKNNPEEAEKHRVSSLTNSIIGKGSNLGYIINNLKTYNIPNEIYDRLQKAKIISNVAGYQPDGNSQKLLKEKYGDVEGKKNANTGNYFEKVVTKRLIDLMEKNKSNLNITEAYYGYEIVKKTGEKEIEFDILFLTKQAQLIYFEAKSYTWEREELNAKLQVIRKYGGAYFNMIVVLPFYCSELDTTMPEKIKKLPFWCKQYEVKFCVITKDENDPFWIVRDKVENKVVYKVVYNQELAQTHNEWVECESLAHYFENPDNHLITES